MSLAALKKQNSLDKLLGAVQSENTSQENVLIIKDNIYDSLYDLIVNIDNDRCELDLKKINPINKDKKRLK